ncbi:hypothetical protein P7C73_g4922, partial [Tremellales sp. Uapishka_1]
PTAALPVIRDPLRPDTTTRRSPDIHPATRRTPHASAQAKAKRRQEGPEVGAEAGAHETAATQAHSRRRARAAVPAGARRMHGAHHGVSSRAHASVRAMAAEGSVESDRRYRPGRGNVGDNLRLYAAQQLIQSPISTRFFRDIRKRSMNIYYHTRQPGICPVPGRDEAEKEVQKAEHKKRKRKEAKEAKRRHEDEERARQAQHKESDSSGPSTPIATPTTSTVSHPLIREPISSEREEYQSKLENELRSTKDDIEDLRYRLADLMRQYVSFACDPSSRAQEEDQRTSRALQDVTSGMLRQYGSPEQEASQTPVLDSMYAELNKDEDTALPGASEEDSSTGANHQDISMLTESLGDTSVRDTVSGLRGDSAVSVERSIRRHSLSVSVFESTKANS